jgi:hypothetical protein
MLFNSENWKKVIWHGNVLEEVFFSSLRKEKSDAAFFIIAMLSSTLWIHVYHCLVVVVKSYFDASFY